MMMTIASVLCLRSGLAPWCPSELFSFSFKLYLKIHLSLFSTVFLHVVFGLPTLRVPSRIHVRTVESLRFWRPVTFPQSSAVESEKLTCLLFWFKSRPNLLRGSLRWCHANLLLSRVDGSMHSFFFTRELCRLTWMLHIFPSCPHAWSTVATYVIAVQWPDLIVYAVVVFNGVDLS